MSDIYFLIQNDTVVNVFSWDGDIEKYQAPAGHTVRKRVNDNGWMYSVWNGSKFIDPKPYESWVMTANKEGWEAPTPMPNDGKTYEWDEGTVSWKDTSPPTANGSTQVL